MGRFGENVAITLILIIVVGFLGGLGYLVKTELIDGNGKLSYAIKQNTEEKNKEKEENKKEDELSVPEKEEEKVETDDKDNDSVEKEDKEDNKTLLCTFSHQIDGTSVYGKDQYNVIFDNNDVAETINYYLIIDFSEYPEVYDAFSNEGFFDEVDKEYKFANIINSDYKYVVDYSLSKKKFLKLDDIPFEKEKDLKYESFKEIIENEGYQCK